MSEVFSTESGAEMSESHMRLSAVYAELLDVASWRIEHPLASSYWLRHRIIGVQVLVTLGAGGTLKFTESPLLRSLVQRIERSYSTGFSARVGTLYQELSEKLAVDWVAAFGERRVAEEEVAAATDRSSGLAKNDDEEKHAVQRCLDQAAPGQARVDRTANGYLEVFVRIQGAPEVFSCLRDLHYGYVAYLGSSFHLLVKDEPWLSAGR